MRNLAKGIVYNYRKEIEKAAFFLREHVQENNSYVDTAKRGALDILQDFEKEIEFYAFKLERIDMQAVGHSLLENLCHLDDKYDKGRLDSSKGNESLTLQTGVVIASLIGNHKMIRVVGEQNSSIANYLRGVYKKFILDPGDPNIEEVSRSFALLYPSDAEISMDFLMRVTQNFTDEINTIPEGEDYFTRHIFKTGFVSYPGIGYEIQRILPDLAKLKK